MPVMDLPYSPTDLLTGSGWKEASSLDTLKQFWFMAGVDTTLRGKSNANKARINENGT
jgi:hypothetical protein